MLGFFRKLRQSLLKEGRISQYLTYALGEILLVTIGILIAIQLNSFYETQTDRKKEQVYLAAYQRDLEFNLKELDRVIEKRQNTKRSMGCLLRWSQEGYEGIPLDSLEAQILRLGFYTLFSSSDGTIDDIMGSAEVKLIQNDRLRKSIVSWESSLKQVEEWERLGQESAQNGIDYMMKNIPVYKTHLQELIVSEKLVEQLFRDQYFLNLLDNQYFISDKLVGYYEDLQKNHRELHNEIERELK